VCGRRPEGADDSGPEVVRCQERHGGATRPAGRTLPAGELVAPARTIRATGRSTQFEPSAICGTRQRRQRYEADGGPHAQITRLRDNGLSGPRPRRRNTIRCSNTIGAMVGTYRHHHRDPHAHENGRCSCERIAVPTCAKPCAMSDISGSYQRRHTPACQQQQQGNGAERCPPLQRPIRQARCSLEPAGNGTAATT